MLVEELVEKSTVLDGLRHVVPTDPADLGFVGEAPSLLFCQFLIVWNCSACVSYPPSHFFFPRRVRRGF